MTTLVNRGLIVLNEHQVNPSDAKAHESTIIVTGVARGGTSMVAQVLSRLGLFLGDTCDPVVVEDTEILRALQASDMNRLESIISNRNQRFRTWGFKVPDLHYFLTPTEGWRFRNPRFIVVFRDPLAIARRNQLSQFQYPARALQRAGENLEKLTSFVCALTEPQLLLSYEKALRNPGDTVEMISSFCGLTPSDAQMKAALEAFSPDDAIYAAATQLVVWGRIDGVQDNILRGWCCWRDTANSLNIELLADTNVIGVFAANEYRDDLQRAGIHDGKNAFNVDLSGFDISSSSVISVRPIGHILTVSNSGKSLGDLRRT